MLQLVQNVLITTKLYGYQLTAYSNFSFLHSFAQFAFPFLRFLVSIIERDLQCGGYRWCTAFRRPPAAAVRVEISKNC
jgi:hypothetical protein